MTEGHGERRRTRTHQQGRRATVMLWTALVAGACASSNPAETTSLSESGITTALECEPHCSTWVYPSKLSKDLVYVPDPEGDRIADFSRVGYQQGANGLPSESAPPEKNPNFADAEVDLDAINWGTSQKPPTTLTAPADLCTNRAKYDHTAVLQALIAARGARVGDPVTGVRGSVNLPRAHFALYDTLTVPDGVVLAGHSANPWNSHNPPLPATVLHLCGRVGVGVQIGGGDAGTLSGSPAIIASDRVPSGGNCLRVPRGMTSFSRGDRVEIRRLDCSLASKVCGWSKWVNGLGMTGVWPLDALNPIVYERTVTVVQPANNGLGSTTDAIVCVDQPVTSALEADYGPNKIERFTTPPLRAKNIGVTRLRIVSDFDYGGACPDNTDPPVSGVAPGDCATCTACAPDPTNPNDSCAGPQCPRQIGIAANDIEDSWIYDVVTERLSQNAVRLQSRSRRITVDGVQYLNPNGPVAGSWRYPLFNMSQTNLVANCYADYARHNYMVHEWTVGPNVFLNSSAEHTKEDSGTHLRWATGTLYDNVAMNSISGSHSYSGQFSAQNVGPTDPHGWQGSSIVFFNTTAYNGYQVFNPIIDAVHYATGAQVPSGSGQNWLIGAVGVQKSFPRAPSASKNELPPHMDGYATALTNSHVKLITTDLAGAPLADPTLGDSLYRTAHYLYPLKTGADAGLDVRNYFVGDADDFTAEPMDGFTDAVYIDPQFKGWLAGKNPLTSYQTFDYTYAPNGNSDAQNVAFSIRYDLAPNETVKFAYLAVRMMRVGAWNQDGDHFIQLAGVGPNFEGFADATANARQYYWRCTSGAPPGCEPLPAELTGPNGWSTNAGSAPDPVSRVRIIELPTSLFGGLLNRTAAEGSRRYGELNANFGVKTRFDWVNLTLVIKRP